MASFAFTDIISKKYGTSVPNWKNLDLSIAFVHYDYDLLQSINSYVTMLLIKN